MDLESLIVEHFLTDSPKDIQTMPLDEKVEFLLKERTLMGHMLAYALRSLQSKNMLEYLPEQARVSGLNSKYTGQDVRKRFTHASMKAKEEIHEWTKSLHLLQEKARQGDYDWLDTRESNLVPHS